MMGMFTQSRNFRMVNDGPYDRLKRLLKIPKDIKERPAKEKTRLYENERNQIIQLQVVRQLVSDAPEVLKNRLGLTEGMKRDLALLKSLSDRIVWGLLQGIPEGQLQNVVNDLSCSALIVGTKRAGKKQDIDDFGVFIEQKHFDSLMGALEEHCLVCQRNSWAEEQQCPLKKTLDDICTDKVHDGECAYRYGIR